MYKNIFIDQCGYQPQMKKYVTFQAQEPVEFSVLRSDGECVMKGSTDKRFENASAKEIDYIGDFSKLTTPGRYYIVAKGLGESDTFEIREDVYADTFQKAMYFFYLQRCGCELPESAAGAYAHGACHTQDAVIYGTQNKISVNGGWHDAGDYGRYVVPGAMAVAQMLLAYEVNPSFMGQYTNAAAHKPELPDYFNELKYELDWMMTMQREDGALYHKVSCYNFCGFILPDQEKEEIVISPVSATATGDFAAAAAMAVRFYQKYDAEYADRLATASRYSFCPVSLYASYRCSPLLAVFILLPQVYSSEARAVPYPSTSSISSLCLPRSIMDALIFSFNSSDTGLEVVIYARLP